MKIDDLLAEYAELADGDRVNSLVCPECEGGRSNERSFTIGRIGPSLWFKCWRSSCGYSGRTRDGRTDSAGVKKPRRRLNFTGGPLPDQLLNELAVKFHVDPSVLIGTGDWGYTDDYGGRVIMPVYGRVGDRRGAVLRSYDPDNLPKTLNDMAEDRPSCAWFTSTYPQTIVLVEDIPSAVCLNACGIDAVALLGTSLTDDKLEDILAARPKKVVIALDSDAFSTAVSMLSSNRHRLPAGSSVLRLSKDAKDMTLEERVETFKEVLNEKHQR